MTTLQANSNEAKPEMNRSNALSIYATPTNVATEYASGIDGRGDNPCVMRLLSIEQLTLIGGGASSGLDSGLATPTVGNVPVLNSRAVLADRAYRK